MIKCLLTELGRAGRENIWPSVISHGPRCARSVRHDLGPNIFPSGPPTQSISTYYDLYCPYFLLEVMVKFTRRATGHFVMLIEIGMHLIESNSGHNLGRAAIL